MVAITHTHCMSCTALRVHFFGAFYCLFAGWFSFFLQWQLVFLFRFTTTSSNWYGRQIKSKAGWHNNCAMRLAPNHTRQIREDALRDEMMICVNEWIRAQSYSWECIWMNTTKSGTFSKLKWRSRRIYFFCKLVTLAYRNFALFLLLSFCLLFVYLCVFLFVLFFSLEVSHNTKQQ